MNVISIEVCQRYVQIPACVAGEFTLTPMQVAVVKVNDLPEKDEQNEFLKKINRIIETMGYMVMILKDYNRLASLDLAWNKFVFLEVVKV